MIKRIKSLFSYKVCKTLALINFIFSMFLDTMTLYTYYHHQKIENIQGFVYIAVSNISFIVFTLLALKKANDDKLYKKISVGNLLKKYYPLMILMIAVTVMAVKLYNIVPIYDASLYYGAFTNIYNLYKFDISSTIGAINLWNNLYLGTALLVSPFECFAVGRYVGTYLANTVLFLITLSVLYKFLEGFLTKSNKWMLTFLVAVFAFSPYSFNLITYICPDFYLELYVIWLMYAYKKENNLMVSFIGFLLCFTKTSGAFIYALFALSMYITDSVIKYRKNKLKWWMPKYWPISKFALWLLPAVIYFITYLIKDKFLLQTFDSMSQASFGLNYVDFTIQSLQNYVFGYRWAILMFAVIAGIVWICKKVGKNSKIGNDIKYITNDCFPQYCSVWISSVVFSSFLSVFKMSHCPRYTTINNVALVLLLSVSVCVLSNKEIVKSALSFVFAGLMISQIYVTTDPAIKALCDPLDTGNYKVYNLVRTKLIPKDTQLEWLPDCLGDVYVYNEEYSVYNDLMNQTLEHYDFKEDTVMQVYNVYMYEIHPGGMQYGIYWNTSTHKRTYKETKHTVRMMCDTIYEENLKDIPFEEYCLLVPAREDSDKAVKILEKAGYVLQDSFTAKSKYGYMNTFRFVKA